MNFIQKEIEELEQMITHCNRVNRKVSQVSAGWHIDHSLQVINMVCKLLINSDPTAYKWSFNFVRSAIFLLNFIPRGKGSAPQSVTPQGEILEETLYSQLEKAKKQSMDTIDLPGDSHFDHPYFGMLDLQMTKKFLLIHTRHHLKIIRDITL